MTIMSVREQRQRAKNAAWYAKTGLRRRLEDPTIQVEGRNERWQREAEERAAREAEHHEHQEADRAAKLTEARKHEISVARSWGKAAAEANAVVDESLLEAINSVLTKLLDRVENLEANVRDLGTTAAAVSKRIDALSGRAKSGSERTGRQLAILERKLQDQHDFARDLKTDLRLLKAKLANRPEPQDQRELHVIHHDR